MHKMIVDQKNLLVDTLAQVTSACASMDGYARRHPEDAHAGDRANLCHEEMDLNRKEIQIAIEALGVQEEASR